MEHLEFARTLEDSESLDRWSAELPLSPLTANAQTIWNKPAKSVWLDGLRMTQLGQDYFLDYSSAADQTTIEAEALKAYRKAFGLAQRLRAPYLVRAWNVIPEINAFHDGIENYQRFCRGRKQAYSEFEIVDSGFPAASAIGSFGNRIYFGFLFSRDPMLLVSNPKQVEAYKYPELYGPISPSFSRAAIHRNKFYLSGTASILGHESLHPNDLYAQTRLTLDNIERVLKQAYDKHDFFADYQSLRYRVYLRNENDFDQVKDWLLAWAGPQTSFDFVKAAICRKELLIEIEGMKE